MPLYIAKKQDGRFPCFKSLGKNVLISDSVRFYNPENISIGDNVRIDDFSILSGGRGIRIGSHIHIACNVSMFGGSGIVINDFCQIAAYSLLLSESDDFSGSSLIGPCVPKKFKPKYKEGKPIILGKHTVIGARSTILPGVTLGEGVSIGAHSLIKMNCISWRIYTGNPLTMIGYREKDILTLEKQFLEEYNYANGKSEYQPA
jgi:acetyltransferase-like isoleucine patch superfamily enzyme